MRSKHCSKGLVFTLESVKAEILRISQKIGKPNLTITDYEKENLHTWTAASKSLGMGFNEIKVLCGLPVHDKKRKEPEDRVRKPKKSTRSKDLCLKCEKVYPKIGYKICANCQDQNNRMGDYGLYGFNEF